MFYILKGRVTFILTLNCSFDKLVAKENQKFLKVFLKYSSNGKPIINNIKLLTKPGRRIFYSLKQIWKIDSNKTFIIFSTNKGLQRIDDCKKLKIGGEPFILIN